MKEMEFVQEWIAESRQEGLALPGAHLTRPRPGMRPPRGRWYRSRMVQRPINQYISKDEGPGIRVRVWMLRWSGVLAGL